MIKTTIFLFALLCLSNTLHTRRQQTLNSLNHNLNEQLCRDKKGTVCGLVKKDCCLKGCSSKFMGFGQECIENKFIDLNLLACDKVCQNKGGEIYTDKFLGAPKCCKKGAIKNQKCQQMDQVELGECENKTLTDKIVNLVKK